MSRVLRTGTILKGNEHSYRITQNIVNKRNNLYLANRNDGLEVVVKSFGYEENFEREREIQEALIAGGRHKNILHMLEAFVDEKDLPHIILPSVQGRDLIKFIDRQRSLLLPHEFLGLFQGICEGISYMHSQGVIHRDIKPGNILLETPKNFRRITKTDLASGKVIPKNTDFEYSFQKDVHPGDSCVGTPGFMSPEALKCRDVNHRADIYSTGVLLYQLLTGKLPFEGNSSFKSQLDTLLAQPSNPMDYSDAITFELKRILLKALEKNQDRRYQSILEFKEDYTKEVERIIGFCEKETAKPYLMRIPNLARI